VEIVEIVETGIRGKIDGFPQKREGGVIIDVISINTGLSHRDPQFEFIPVSQANNSLRLLRDVRNQQDFINQRRAKLVEIADGLAEPEDLVQIHARLIKEEGFEGVTIQNVRDDFRYTSSAFHRHEKVIIREVQERDQDFINQRRTKLVEIADGLAEPEDLVQIHARLIKEEGFEGVTIKDVRNDFRYTSSAFHGHEKVIIREVQERDQDFINQRRTKLVEIADGLE